MIRRRRTCAPILLALWLAACATPPTTVADLRPISDKAAAEARVDPRAALALVNAHRAAAGLAGLRLEPALVQMAQRQADAMAAADHMSHDVAGSFSARLAQSGVGAVAAAENIAEGPMTTRDALIVWETSPGHNANLLLPEATRFGVALARNPASRYQVFWAMVVAADPRPPAQGGGYFGSCAPFC